MSVYPTEEEREREGLVSIEEQIIHDLSRASVHIGAIGNLGPGEHKVEIVIRGSEGASALATRLRAHAEWLREKFSLPVVTP